MHKAHQTEISDGKPYAVSLEDVVLRIRKDHQSSQYKCLKCDSVIISRLKLSHHLCVDPEGQITCKVLCPDGVGLTNWQTVTFLKRKREYLCHTCGTAFTDRTTFQMHVQSHGRGVELKKFICDHCPYATNNRFYFKIHMRGQHCDEPRPRPHVCELCGKTFVLRGVLMQHKQYMHIKDKIFQCNQCPKFFYRHQGLARHLRTHSGQRPWVCVTCGQGFTVKYNLKVHERLHSGEKPYQCKQCDAAFAQKNSLNVHMKKHEGGGSGGHSRSRTYNTQNPATSSQRDHVQCQDINQTVDITQASKELSQSTRRSSVQTNQGDASESSQMGSPQQSSQACPSSSLSVPSCVAHARDASALNPRPMQYGYASYPDYAMTVFPSLPGPSYQFLPVTRP